MEIPEIVVPGRPAVGCYPCRGASGAGRGHRICPELTAFFGCLYYAALRRAEAVALHATSCTLPASGWGQLTLTGSLPRSARAWTGNGTPRDPAASTTAPAAPAGQSRSPRNSSGSCSSTCTPMGPSPTGGCSGRPRRAAQRKPLRPDLAPGPQRCGHVGPDAPASLRPASCRAVAVAGLRCPARRGRCPRRAQRPRPARRLRPLHTRLRPDRQPAHRGSPQPQPLAPRWPTRTGADPGNPVRHASVPQLDSTGHSWT
jgi:hypothetical protein